MARFKYSALARHLITQQADRVTLTLPEIEALVGAPLPASASGPEFWRNGRPGPGPTWAWRAVGWRVAERRYQRPTWAITFVRDGTGTEDTDSQ